MGRLARDPMRVVHQLVVCPPLISSESHRLPLVQQLHSGGQASKTTANDSHLELGGALLGQQPGGFQ